MQVSQIPPTPYDKVVTVCAASAARKDACIGLLFSDEIIQAAPSYTEPRFKEHLITILQHEDVARFFGPVVWGQLVSCQPRQALFISTDISYLDRAGLDTRNTFFIKYHDVIVMCHYEDIYNQCSRLEKLINCNKCHLESDWECVQRNLPEILPVVAQHIPEIHSDPRQCVFAYSDLYLQREHELQPHISGLYIGNCWSALDENLRNYDDWHTAKYHYWKQYIAGYWLVSPIATNHNGLHPAVHSIRMPKEHDFAEVSCNHKAIVSRAENAASTRKTIRTECSHCYFGYTTYRSKQMPCNKWSASRCKHGAWTLEELIQITFNEVEKRLTETKSCFTLDDLWRIANVCGVPFKRINESTGRTHEWVLSRYNRETHIVAYKTARSCRSSLGGSCTEILHSIEEVTAFLTGDVKEILWSSIKSLNRNNIDECERFAVWLQLASTSQGKGYAGHPNSGFMWHQPPIGFVSMSGHGVTTALWLTRKERLHHFSSFQAVYNHYQRLLLFSMHYAIGPSLDQNQAEES